MPLYSDGPFSYVFFVIDRDGVDTFTRRHHRVAPARSQVSTILSGSTGGPSFTDVFVRTSLLRAA